MFSNYKPF